MEPEGYRTFAAARRALLDAGYLQGFSSPGRPTLWAKPNSAKQDHRAIVQHVGELNWSIVPYPEPPTCLPAQLLDLQLRDASFVDDAVPPADDDLSFLE